MQLILLPGGVPGFFFFSGCVFMELADYSRILVDLYPGDRVRV